MTSSNITPPNIAQLTAYQAGKPIDELQRELGITSVVKLASNENPLGPSPRVLAALRDALTTHPALHRYPDPSAYHLRQALVQHHHQHPHQHNNTTTHPHTIQPDQLCFGNGSNELIDMLCRVFAGPGDHAVFGAPSFVCYRAGCLAANINFTAVPLTDHLHWDVPAMLAAVQPTTKLLFLANPNNPTGAYIGRDTLAHLLSSLPKHVIPVIDEAYIEYADTDTDTDTGTDDFVSALAYRDLHPHLVVLRTFSKAYGLSALRVGYAVTSAELVAWLERLRAPFNVNSLGQLAAQAALQDQAHLARVVAMNRRERTRLTDALQARGYTVAPSQANFVLFACQQPGRALYDALLHQGVITRPLGPPLHQHLRVSVGLPEENTRFLQALDDVRALL